MLLLLLICFSHNCFKILYHHSKLFVVAPCQHARLEIDFSQFEPYHCYFKLPFFGFWGSKGVVGSGPSQKWVSYGTLRHS